MIKAANPTHDTEVPAGTMAFRKDQYALARGSFEIMLVIFDVELLTSICAVELAETGVQCDGGRAPEGK
jgi:hypothetical protein